MKKLTCLFLCLCLMFLSSCSSYRKMDIFSFLAEYEAIEPTIQRKNNILVRDDTYYIFYQSESNGVFLMTVAVDSLQVPQIVKLFYSVHTGLTPDEIYNLSCSCLQAFTRSDRAACEQIFTLLQANNPDAYFKKFNGRADTEQHVCKLTSLALLTVFDFQVRYPATASTAAPT